MEREAGEEARNVEREGEEGRWRGGAEMKGREEMRRMEERWRREQRHREREGKEAEREKRDHLPEAWYTSCSTPHAV